MSSLARKLKISVPAVSKSAIRGEKLAKARKYSLVGKLKLKSPHGVMWEGGIGSFIHHSFT